jgi:hypothetical protein
MLGRAGQVKSCGALSAHECQGPECSSDRFGLSAAQQGSGESGKVGGQKVEWIAKANRNSCRVAS